MHLDSTLRGLLVFAAVYLVLVWAGFRWARWRVNQVARSTAAALQGAGARILAQRPTPSLWRAAEADFELDGKAAKLVVRQWGRNSQTIGVRIQAPPMPTIWLRRERGFDRVGKALALEREVQLGVKDFDDAVFIASAAPDDVVRRALAGPEVQRLVREIVARRYSVFMSHDGLQATTLRYYWGAAQFDAEGVAPVLGLLRELAAALPALEPAVTARGRMPLPTIAVIAPAYLCIFVPMLLLMPGLRDFVRPPMDASHVVVGLGLGLVLVPGAIYLASRQLRGRPLAMFEMLAVGFALLASLPFVGAFLLFALNAQLDGGATTVHRARVVDYYKHNAHTVYVAPWSGADDREKVIVPPSLGTLNVGDALEVDTHPGAFGWPWVSEVRRGQ